MKAWNANTLDYICDKLKLYQFVVVVKKVAAAMDVHIQ